jgi:hypothetical protein
VLLDLDAAFITPYLSVYAFSILEIFFYHVGYFEMKLCIRIYCGKGKIKIGNTFQNCESNLFNANQQGSLKLKGFKLLAFSKV